MKRALIIEDDENNFVLIADLLSHSGYSPMRAESGEAGINLAVSEMPDFILLDIKLPDIDGYTVLARIKNMPSIQSIPVVAMTSYAMSGDRERLLAAGCQGYIEKPIDPMSVIQQIQEILAEQI